MTLIRRMQSFFRKKEMQDLESELQFHLEKEVEQNTLRGMSPQEARRRALIAFGGVQQTREAVRETRWTHFVEVVAQDLRYAWRMLRKSPGFTSVAVLTLALGIGMNTAVFNLLDDVLFRNLPARHPEELVVFRWHAHSDPYLGYTSYGDCIEKFQRKDASGCSLSLPFFRAVRELPGAFSGLAASAGPPCQLALSSGGPAKEVNEAQLVSGEYFQTLGVGAATGRTLGRADDTPTAQPALMISYGYWKNAFGGDPSVVGKTVRLNGIPMDIVGVAEQGFSGLTPGRVVELWLPLSMRSRLVPELGVDQENTTHGWLVIVGRHKPGVLVAQAQAAVSLLFHNQTLHGEKTILKAADEPGIDLMPAQQALKGNREESTLPPLYILMMAAGLVLLIACANIAGLLLTRTAAREKEMAVRLTLGARRGRLVSQLLTESLMLALMGGAIGLYLAHWGAQLLNALSAGPQGRSQFAPQIDVRVLAFTAAVSVFAGVFFGLIPSFLGLRQDLTPVLNASGSGNSSTGPRRFWFSPGNGLVVAQVALAMVALVCAGKLAHTLANLRNIDPGFDMHNMLVFGIDGGVAGYKEEGVDLLYRELREKFAAVPGVIAASYSANSLLSGFLYMGDVHVPGKPDLENEHADRFFAGPGFFSTMRIPIQTGRDFTDADFAIAHADAAASRAMRAGHGVALVPVPAIVNETLVHRFFPQKNPLGQLLEEPLPRDPAERRGPGWQIVGVVRDAKYNDLRRDINPTMYVPISGGSAVFELRTVADPLQLVSAMREITNRTSNSLALFDIATQSSQVDDLLSQERRIAQLSSFFGLLALVLACAGIYGLLSYEVTRRTREIGIRMAIGAQRSDVVGMVLRKGLWMALAGAALGIAGSFAAARLLTAILYQVTPADPWVLVAVAVLLVLVALLASCFPARRATKVDPLVSLRHE
jgi:predicted permease